MNKKGPFKYLGYLPHLFIVTVYRTQFLVNDLFNNWKLRMTFLLVMCNSWRWSKILAKCMSSQEVIFI